MRWHVLWLGRMGARVGEVRFERQIVDGILTARATEPRKVGRPLLAHQKHREEVASSGSLPVAETRTGLDLVVT